MVVRVARLLERVVFAVKMRRSPARERLHRQISRLPQGALEAAGDSISSRQNALDELTLHDHYRLVIKVSNVLSKRNRPRSAETTVR